MKLVRFLVCLFLLGALGNFADAQSLSLERVANGLNNPLFATYAPGDADRLYIAQRAGAIRILNLNTGNLNAANFVNVPGVNSSFEGGFLGLAFHPDFENNNFFYVNYTTSSGGPFRNRISRFTATNSDTASAATEQVIIEVNQPQQNHNAGWIGFGPDGLLYITMGDGGGGNDTGPGHTAGIGNGQDITDNLLGKMLRLDVDGDDFPADNLRNYAIPPTNPFVGTTGDDEIYLYGLRNPFRCSFDRLTGDLYIGDVGQGAREEINVIPNGYSGDMNLGWRLREGTITTPGVGGAQPADGVNPVYDYIRTGPFGGNSVTGGTVYRGPVAALQGNYFFADHGSNNFWSFRYDGSDPSTFNGNNIQDLIRWNGIFQTDVGNPGTIVAFGEDLEGNVYICDRTGGEIFKICDGATSNPPIDVGLTIIAASAGTLESGTLADLSTGDDNALVYRADASAKGADAVALLIFGNSPETNISTMILNFEGQVGTSNVGQTIELFNYSTNQFETVDSRNATFGDESFSVEIDTNAADYVFVTGEVRARLRFAPSGPVFQFPWAARIDQFSIQVTE